MLITMLAAQRDSKAKLDVGRVDTVFKVGDRVLMLTKELFDAAAIGILHPPWDGPFRVTVIACTNPNTHTLALPRRLLCHSPTINVDRLKAFHECADSQPAPGPVDDPGQ
jgi:hypothetical protein